MPMNDREALTPAGVEIVEALTEFYETLRQGREGIENRLTVRTVETEIGRVAR